MIAAVFANRLRRKMKLQTDPSVIYGMGEKFDGNLRKRDLVTDTPFNTYTRLGLPPHPIAMPGLASLDAVMHPAQTDALYFVSRGDGTSEFSRTLVEHNRAVAKYQMPGARLRELGRFRTLYRCHLCISRRRAWHGDGPDRGARALGSRRAAAGPDSRFRRTRRGGARTAREEAGRSLRAREPGLLRTCPGRVSSAHCGRAPPDESGPVGEGTARSQEG